MSYCLNPDCKKPYNPDEAKICSNCGSDLLLYSRYRIIRPLGNPGGFGRTFLASDTEKQIRCAVKQFCPLPQIQNNQQALQKATELFNQEARQLQQLGQHPQIPALLDYFEADSRLYLVQEFIEGKDLAATLQEEGAFSEEKIRELLGEILKILQYIHEHRVIHRDIKPENIIYSPAKKGYALIDFGISKQLAQTTVAQTGTAYLGTPGYAPIEQLLWGKAYPASDLYSLGMTCLHLLTTVAPDELYEPQERRWLWRDRLLEKGIKISPNLEKVLDKMVKQTLQERYQSAAEVLEDLNFFNYELKIYNSANPIRVAKLGKADFRTISEAIKNAQPGTKIIVEPGFYEESLVIDKFLEIIGNGVREDIIVESIFSPCLTMQAEEAIVKNLTFCYKDLTNSQNADILGRFLSEKILKLFAVDISKGRLRLENCEISSTGMAGINISGKGTNPFIYQCKIYEAAKYGILLSKNSSATIEACDIFGQKFGIYILKGCNPTVRRCKIHDMQADGIFVSGNGEGTVENCDIIGNNKAGVRIKKKGNLTVRQCNINKNKEQGIYVESNGAGPIENCDLRGNEGGAWYVAPKCLPRRSGNRE